MKRIKNYMASLDRDVTVNGKLLFFELATALLSGLVLGLLFAPLRSVTIGSNNENNGNGNSAGVEEGK